MACLNKGRLMPFPIKALGDCIYGGFVYLQNLNLFFSAEMWGPLKYPLKHAGLPTLQLHGMSRNVPRPSSLRVNIVHQFIFQASKQVVIHYKFTWREKSFHHGKAGISIPFFYSSALLCSAVLDLNTVSLHWPLRLARSWFVTPWKSRTARNNLIIFHAPHPRTTFTWTHFQF